jgi:hypothetical protein
LQLRLKDTADRPSCCFDVFASMSFSTSLPRCLCLAQCRSGNASPPSAHLYCSASNRYGNPPAIVIRQQSLHGVARMNGARGRGGRRLCCVTWRYLEAAACRGSMRNQT